MIALVVGSPSDFEVLDAVGFAPSVEVSAIVLALAPSDEVPARIVLAPSVEVPASVRSPSVEDVLTVKGPALVEQPMDEGCEMLLAIEWRVAQGF